MGLFNFFKSGQDPKTEHSVDDGNFDEDYDEEDDDDESLSVYDAALIWQSNGQDEDYTFGYTTDELRDAL